MTMRVAGLWTHYAGAFTVRESSVDWVKPGDDIEFGRYGSPDVYINEVASGEELVVPAAELSVMAIGASRWRILRRDELLFEVAHVPPEFRQRDFKPPPGYGLIARFLKRPAWPTPEWVTLDELLAPNEDPTTFRS